MPEYRQSKSKSKSHSKSGGRRKKQTMRKLRRGRKSRKVMRGGDTSLQQVIVNNPEAMNLLIANGLNVTTVTKAQIENTPGLKQKLINKGIDITNY